MAHSPWGPPSSCRNVRFYLSDSDVWDWLQSQPNKQSYIRDLIREDMERGREA